MLKDFRYPIWWNSFLVEYITTPIDLKKEIANPVRRASIKLEEVFFLRRGIIAYKTLHILESYP